MHILYTYMPIYINILAFDSRTGGKDWIKLKNLEYDGKCLKWTGELDYLKKFIEICRQRQMALAWRFTSG